MVESSLSRDKSTFLAQAVIKKAPFRQSTGWEQPVDYWVGLTAARRWKAPRVRGSCPSSRRGCGGSPCAGGASRRSPAVSRGFVPAPCARLSGRRRREPVTGGVRADRVGAKLPSERSRGEALAGTFTSSVAPGSETAWPVVLAGPPAHGCPQKCQGGNSRCVARGGRSIRGRAGEPW